MTTTAVGLSAIGGIAQGPRFSRRLSDVNTTDLDGELDLGLDLASQPLLQLGPEDWARLNNDTSAVNFVNQHREYVCDLNTRMLEAHGLNCTTLPASDPRVQLNPLLCSTCETIEVPVSTSVAAATAAPQAAPQAMDPFIWIMMALAFLVVGMLIGVLGYKYCSGYHAEGKTECSDELDEGEVRNAKSSTRIEVGEGSSASTRHTGGADVTGKDLEQQVLENLRPVEC